MTGGRGDVTGGGCHCHGVPGVHHLGVGAVRGKHPVGAGGATAPILGDLGHMHPPCPAAHWVRGAGWRQGRINGSASLAGYL